ncbi:Hypothetical protein, putative [Bodo saltans]|uniref:Uncharacterized protein n=1 Tax=Bodo saltans TaxID=75058 RepID=A0A0S4JFT6_BODSA|nr:Hypothetical protein, putative [Bodo saltans]|eukprot:CUG89129.1 Hypothetical protein, putative [Bodo saltans]
MEGDVPRAALQQHEETGPMSTATAATPMMKEKTATEDSAALPTAAGLPQDEITTTPDEEQHDETASAQQSLRKDRLPKSVSITLHAIFLPRHSVEAPLIRGDGDDAAAGGGLNSTDPSAEVLIAPPLPRAPPKLVPLQNVTFIRVSLPRASASSSNEASTPNTTEELAAGGNLSSSPSRPSTSDDTTASDVYDEVMVLRRDHEGNKRTLSSIPDVAGQFSNAGGGDVAMMFCASVHSMHW